MQLSSWQNEHSRTACGMEHSGPVGGRPPADTPSAPLGVGVPLTRQWPRRGRRPAHAPSAPRSPCPVGGRGRGEGGRQRPCGPDGGRRPAHTPAALRCPWPRRGRRPVHTPSEARWLVGWLLGWLVGWGSNALRASKDPPSPRDAKMIPTSLTLRISPPPHPETMPDGRS